jgi:hypothetical protein
MKSQNLTRAQKNLIAELRTSAGFNLLLECLEDELNLIQDILLSNSDPRFDSAVCARWREYKRLLSFLREWPKALAEEPQDVPEVDEQSFFRTGKSNLAEYRKKFEEELRKSYGLPAADALN